MSQARPEPFDLPEWHAMRREASLVSQLIGSGATALGRASYGDGFGEYYTAFFGLSIGVERLAKMILVADHVVSHAGALPSPKAVKAFGHKLGPLIDAADKIATSRQLELTYARPTDPICGAIIDCLASFAEASQGRYANFEAIGNPAFDRTHEPVERWWVNVVEPALIKHYRGRAAEARVRRNAEIVAALMGDSVTVLHTDERGRMMTDIATASERSGQTEQARKYGRLYTLRVVRWLADIFTELTHPTGYSDYLTVLFGHYELFVTYRNPDGFLLTRKRWPK
ncbi:hypothetical protein ACYZX9_14920 [Sphingomonas citri]